MDFLTEIEYWQNPQGNCPIEQFILKLPAKHQAWIAKKDVFFESMSVRELMRSSYFEKVSDTELWELKYSGSGGYNYRMLCIIWHRGIVALVMFQGSGSGGKLNKYITRAQANAEDWKNRHSQ
jgi:hypothetical protein